MSSITYNKLWQEAQMQLNDLLQIEQPKTEPKPENVTIIKDFDYIFTA